MLNCTLVAAVHSVLLHLSNALRHLPGLPFPQGFLYVRSCKADNEYAHPLDL